MGIKQWKDIIMEVIDILKINATDEINIVIPKNKYNYFYKPGSVLHIYDQIVIEFKQKKKKIQISSDMLDNLYEVFTDVLNAVVQNKIVVPGEIEVGCVGYWYNMYIENETDVEFLLALPLALCGNGDWQMWLYSKSDKIYLEISPLYPWLYDGSKQKEKYIPFQEYMKTYKPIALYELSKETVEQWLVQCEKVFASADKSTIHSQA